MGQDENFAEVLPREEVRGIMWEKGWDGVGPIALDNYMQAITDISRAGIVFGRLIEWGKPVEDMEVSPDLVSVFPISFAKGELNDIQAAAYRDGKNMHDWCHDVLMSVAQLTTRSPE